MSRVPVILASASMGQMDGQRVGGAGIVAKYGLGFVDVYFTLLRYLRIKFTGVCARSKAVNVTRCEVECCSSDGPHRHQTGQ